MKQLALAIHNFAGVYGHLPLAIERTGDGRLWRSWRSHLYPTWIAQLPPIYDESTAWDSKSNIRLLDGTPISMRTKGEATYMQAMERVPMCFSCPSCNDQSGVNYVVVTGEGTAFPTSNPISFDDITDGLENTLLIVESVTCTPHWTEPRDLDINTIDFKINSPEGPSISSYHPSGAHVCFADGAVFFLTEAVTEAEVIAMLTISGGENVRRAELVNRGVLVGH